MMDKKSPGNEVYDPRRVFRGRVSASHRLSGIKTCKFSLYLTRFSANPVSNNSALTMDAKNV